MKQFLDKLSMPLLIIIALLFGLAPFMQEPHLWQKTKMLLGGELSKPIDIFDLLMHGTPLLLLVLKSFFLFSPRTEKSES